MDNEMHIKYKHIKLDPPLIEMFTELIEKDEITRSIFVYIGKQMVLSPNPTSSVTKIGATINGIANNLIVSRRVKRKVRGRVTFELVETTVERKNVERVMNTLLLTGLCYYEKVGNTKVIYPTERGISVLKSLHSKDKGLKE